MTEPSVQELLNAAAARLKTVGIDQPWREARLMLAAASGETLAHIMAWPEAPVAKAHADLFDAWLDRRVAEEPLSRILGRREFWSLPFIVTPDTLDPRADSETLVAAVLAALPECDRPYRFVDFGTGTGCLLLTLLSEYRQAWGLGVDRSVAAARVAARNAEALGLTARASFVVADWDSAIVGSFDLMVANPPYIPSAEIESLMPAVRLYDPLTALDGGGDGLDAYRHLSRAAVRLLRPGGRVFFEHGQGQADDVVALAQAEGLSDPIRHADLAGIDRVVGAKWLAGS